MRMPFGGAHPSMATHNHLSALSDSSFLEIIATDPAAAPSRRKRWFNLDDAQFQQHLDANGPKLTTWVVGTTDLPASLALLRDAGLDAGEPVPVSRGDLSWQIGLLPDGTLACDGVFPILIQWPRNTNPVERMSKQGLQLERVCLKHPESDRINAALALIGADHLAEVQEGETSLSAKLSVGERVIQLG